MDIIENFKKQAFRRRLSPRTIKTYLFYIRRFMVFNRKHPNEWSKKDLKEYLLHLSDKGYAGKTLNVAFMAVLFLMREVLNKDWNIKLKCSRTARKLPIVLTQEETKRLISVIKNRKHKLMVKLMYSAGLRVSELVKLKVEHLEGKYGWVRRSKYNKDRMFIIAESIKDDLKNWIEENNLGRNDYLFKGNNTHIHSRSMQLIIERAAKKAGIKKNVHPHTLRHSFATHLIENGYDVATIQSLLGHSSAQTSMIYIHTARPNLINVTSPLDNLLYQ